MRWREDLFDETPAPTARAAARPARGRGGRPEAPRERWEGTLVDAARPVLEAVLLLHRGGPGFDPTFTEFRRTVNAALDDFRIQARRMGVMDEEIQAARYALVGFADEMVSVSSWSGKDQWDGQPLEQEHFNSTLAGNQFFEKIDALRDSQRQVLEVYYVCLTLGFEGGYRGDDHDKQRDLGARIEALRRRLGVPTPNWDQPIFDAAYHPLRSSERAKRRMGRLWLILGSSVAGATVVFYLVYWLLLLQKAGESASVLSRG